MGWLWEKSNQLSLTKKPKEKLVHTCGRNYFIVDKIAEDIYRISLKEKYQVDLGQIMSLNYEGLWEWAY